MKKVHRESTIKSRETKQSDKVDHKRRDKVECESGVRKQTEKVCEKVERKGRV